MERKLKGGSREKERRERKKSKREERKEKRAWGMRNR